MSGPRSCNLFVFTFRQKADISPRPVIWSSAGAREEGEDDERSPLVNRDAAGPDDNTGTKREYNTDHQYDFEISPPKKIKKIKQTNYNSPSKKEGKKGGGEEKARGGGE